MIEVIETGTPEGTRAIVVGGPTRVQILPLPARTRAAYRVFLNSIHSKQTYRHVPAHTSRGGYAVCRAGKPDRRVAAYPDAVVIAVRYAAMAPT
jgi:hypothetical protein